MRRQIPLLRGLAILAVVCNHATGWGYTAMFWWTDRYRTVGSLPNYDQQGSLSYYGLVVIQQLALFSVPAFLFISGFFIAYAARGNPPALSRKIVRTRIEALLWPYLVWSLAIFIGDGLQGEWHSPAEYVRRLVFGDAIGAYFFVPLLCQFYLLSPLAARFGKPRWRSLLVVSAFVQVVAIGLLYLPLLDVEVPDAFYTTPWLFVWQIIYFPLGTVCGFHYSRLKAWLAQVKKILLVAVIVLGALSIIESEAIYRETLNYGWARGGLKFSSVSYALTFILLFLAIDNISLPYTRAITKIGAKSYGIYLIHPKILELVARLINQATPGLLAYQVIFQPALIVPAVGIPILLMTWIAKSRAKKFYPYLFGTG